MFLPDNLPIQFLQVGAHACHKLLLEAVPLAQKLRGGELHRSIHRKISVGNDLQPGEGLTFLRFRAAHNQPCQLHLGQPSNLREPAHCESKRANISGKAHRQIMTQ